MVMTAFFAFMVVTGLAWYAHDYFSGKEIEATGSVLAKNVGRLDRAGLTLEKLEARRAIFRVDHRVYQGVPTAVLKNLEAHWGSPVRVAALGNGRVSCEPAPEE
ncbi:hypothetical protein ACGLFO_02970 [Corynebacterium hesseae]|uniref:hypothetical protein n=1 Tax=Corynebacterium hesseae TaxID=2913502 RepID=UPI00373E2067